VPPHSPQLKMKRNLTCLPVGQPETGGRFYTGSRRGRRWRYRWLRQRIRHYVARPCYVANVRGILRHVRQLAALLGRPGVGSAVDDGGERLVVHVVGESPALQHEPDVADSQEARQKLAVEGRVLDLGRL
jgi:hypothetical protein